MSDIERTDPNSIAIVEAALIIEAGAAKDFDKLIVITCDLDKKIGRYAKRARITLDEARTEVQRRSAAQLSDEEKAAHADFLIDNSGPLEDTAFYVDILWTHLTEFSDSTDDRRSPGPPRVQ
jgi:dephospho-CoA kinase